MKKRFFTSQFPGFFIVSALGVLLHFLYEWTGESLFVASFSGVNESTWEHMKLLYFSMLIFAVIQWFFKENKSRNFWNIKLMGIITGLILIPIIFYTYNGAFGKSPDWVNIAIFFVSAAIALIREGVLFKRNEPYILSPLMAFIAICLIGVLFVLFTFFTPHIPLFKDPVTGIYGI
ncbi:MAG: hypothetical protein E7315_04890 [Clostridiales bacterium]|nr:hypothetical protein [Clostridiales bacterium]